MFWDYRDALTFVGPGGLRLCASCVHSRCGAQAPGREPLTAVPAEPWDRCTECFKLARTADTTPVPNADGSFPPGCDWEHDEERPLTREYPAALAGFVYDLVFDHPELPGIAHFALLVIAPDGCEIYDASTKNPAPRALERAVLDGAHGIRVRAAGLVREYRFRCGLCDWRRFTIDRVERVEALRWEALGPETPGDRPADARELPPEPTRGVQMTEEERHHG